jgi:hypothetical protein
MSEMIHRIVGVPEGLEPGEYDIRFVRVCGDIVIFEYVGPTKTEDENND